MSWFTLVTGIVKIVGIILDYLRDRRMLDEAKKQILADQLVDLAKRGEVQKAVELRIASLSDDAVVDELSKRGDFRD